MSNEPRYERLSILSKKAGPLSLRLWLVLILGGIIAMMYFGRSIPNITNAQYVQKLINEGTLKRTAGSFIRDVMPKNPPNEHTPATVKEHAKWTIVANNLAACMQKNADAYLVSGDPFLQQKFTRESAPVVAKRLMETCGIMKYLPPKKSK